MSKGAKKAKSKASKTTKKTAKPRSPRYALWVASGRQAKTVAQAHEALRGVIEWMGVEEHFIQFTDAELDRIAKEALAVADTARRLAEVAASKRSRTLIA